MKNSLRVYDDVAASKLWIFLDGIKNDIIKEEKGASDGSVAVTAAPIADAAPSTNTSSADRQPSETPAKGSARKGMLSCARSGHSARSTALLVQYKCTPQKHLHVLNNLLARKIESPTEQVCCKKSHEALEARFISLTDMLHLRSD